MLSVGDATKRTGIPGWLIRKLVDQGDVKATRVSRYRILADEDLPQLVEAAKKVKPRTPRREPAGAVAAYAKEIGHTDPVPER